MSKATSWYVAFHDIDRLGAARSSVSTMHGILIEL